MAYIPVACSATLLQPVALFLKQTETEEILSNVVIETSRARCVYTAYKHCPLFFMKVPFLSAG
jgi:hypothetical protein